MLACLLLQVSQRCLFALLPMMKEVPMAPRSRPKRFFSPICFGMYCWRVMPYVWTSGRKGAGDRLLSETGFR